MSLYYYRHGHEGNKLRDLTRKVCSKDELQDDYFFIDNNKEELSSEMLHSMGNKV